MKYFYWPSLNPIIFTIGPVSFYWYGLMYILGFLCAMFLLKNRINNKYNIFFTKKDIEQVLYIVFLGILFGGRIGYVLLYQWPFFSQNLLLIFCVWTGGMSFHGGLIGSIIAIMYISYRKNWSFFQISDFLVPVVPIGLGLGRLGNFINGELYGRVSIYTPWAMFFPQAKNQDLLILQNYPEWKILFDRFGALPRHPSQLYELFLEGIILFIIIKLFTHKLRSKGSISGIFLVFYGILRIIAECFRQPDVHIGFIIYGSITMGQILSVPMIILGIIIIFLSYKDKIY